MVLTWDEQDMEIKSKTISTLISSSIQDVKLSFHHLMIQICIILSSQLKLDRAIADYLNPSLTKLDKPQSLHSSIAAVL